MMKVLVLNAGSSSLKYKLFDMAQRQALASGQVERVGCLDASVTHRWSRADGSAEQVSSELAVATQAAALELIVAHLAASELVLSEQDLSAIGHRVVHGGEEFSQPVLIDDAVSASIAAMIPLAPLHNPANLEGISVARQRWPNLPQVAVFDTAFHQTMPAAAYRYAVPKHWYHQHGVRRYGFHGSSHRFVSRAAAQFLQLPLHDFNAISLHLGNGCSATAIRQGLSVDTSMGMTPLQGLLMGTRCGDLDPSIAFYLQREAQLPAAAVESALNKQSGLKGICDISDMRELSAAVAAGDEDAALAEALFVYRIKHYIGAYLAILGGLDALIFTGGIGEHSARIRALVCDGLAHFGLHLSATANAMAAQEIRSISASAAGPQILVVPTDEELEIANSVVELLS